MYCAYFRACIGREPLNIKSPRGLVSAAMRCCQRFRITRTTAVWRPAVETSDLFGVRAPHRLTRPRRIRGQSQESVGLANRTCQLRLGMAAQSRQRYGASLRSFRSVAVAAMASDLNSTTDRPFSCRADSGGHETRRASIDSAIRCVDARFSAMGSSNCHYSAASGQLGCRVGGAVT